MASLISKNSYQSESSRWRAVAARDKGADGCFVYGVATTGIYCRPGCPSRQPKRENVRFFEHHQAAEDAGYRPCKRCQPQAAEPFDAAADAVKVACQLIETAERPPTLAQLADAVGLSKYHFHRLFKRVVGITPNQYAAEKRLEKVRVRIQQDDTITEAVFNAGYESTSRFYQHATPSLGMKPKEYKNGGVEMIIRFAIVSSYLGQMLVALSERGVCRIDLDESADLLQARLIASFPHAKLIPDAPGLGETVARVLTCLEQPGQGGDLPLDIQGTAFQRRVWSALQEIPAGTTASYAQVAAAVGNPKAVRAVAGACGANKIAVLIPCHRVVRSSGGLGGYRWGTDRKQRLLDHEAESVG